MKPAKKCDECCGGRPLPIEPPWDRFLEGACIKCKGLGYLDCVPLGSLRVGTVFAYGNGAEYEIVERYSDGNVAIVGRPGTKWAGDRQGECRMGMPVRVVGGERRK